MSYWFPRKHNCNSSYGCWIPKFTPILKSPTRDVLRIEVEAFGGDATFIFNVSSLLGSFGPIFVTTENGMGFTDITDLDPLEYTITQDPLPGWQITTQLERTVIPGEIVTATFSNSTFATLTVNKIANGGDATFNFIMSAGDDFSITTVGGTGSVTFTAFPVPLIVTELPTEGWTGNISQEITLVPSGSGTLLFTNYRLDT